MKKILVISEHSVPQHSKLFSSESVSVSTVNIDNFQEKFVGSHEIFLFFNKSHLTSENFFDTSNLDKLVDTWGYFFENEIDVSNKIFCICCDVNPGDTKKINEILNPMNIDVVYLPIHNSMIPENKIICGSLNSDVFHQITDLFSVISKDVESYQTTSTSAELINLTLSQIKISQNIHLETVRSILSNFSEKDDYKIFQIFSPIKHEVEFFEDILRNRVLSSYLNGSTKLINSAKRNIEEKTSLEISFINQVIDLVPDKKTPIIVNKLCYPNSTNLHVGKYQIIKSLMEYGYKINVIEDLDFIKGPIPKEMINDFGSNLKFYPKNSKVDGILIDF